MQTQQFCDGIFLMWSTLILLRLYLQHLCLPMTHSPHLSKAKNNDKGYIFAIKSSGAKEIKDGGMRDETEDSS